MAGRIIQTLLLEKHIEGFLTRLTISCVLAFFLSYIISVSQHIKNMTVTNVDKNYLKNIR